MNEQNIDRKFQVNSRSAPINSPRAAESVSENIAAKADSDLVKVQPSPVSSPKLSNAQDLGGQLLTRLQGGELLIINPRRKNGLIIYKSYHAEFAGPGAIIGGQFDLDVSQLLAVGNLSFIPPPNSQAKKRAYKMRRQWVRLTEQIIDNPQPMERAQVILNQFEHWFDRETVADLPDEAFALLVGVLPQTIRKVRNIELL